jgi:hypothetical protein
VQLIVHSFCVLEFVGAVLRICSLNSTLGLLEDYMQMTKELPLNFTTVVHCHKMNLSWPVHFMQVLAYDMDPILHRHCNSVMDA